jgi:LysR family transcriptional regulator (chromosome initiation inhibitor)
MTIDSAQLATFHAVVTDGSFEAAARSLHLTASAVSLRIKALEQAVGQVLVQRVKPCAPTEAGRSLFRLAGQVALLETEALEAARGPLAGGRTRTRVAIVVNADSLLTWFLPALAGLPAEPALSFDLHCDDQDHTADILRAGTAMAAVTAQHVAVQGCRVEPLGAMRYVAVAAPDVHAQHFAGGPADPSFVAAPMLVLNRKDRLQHRYLDMVTTGEVDPPIHYVPAASAFVEAVRLGLGWGLVPEQIARPDIAAGRCVELIPGRYVDVPLYWQYWRLESSVLGALTAAVRSAARSALR